MKVLESRYDVVPGWENSTFSDRALLCTCGGCLSFDYFLHHCSSAGKHIEVNPIKKNCQPSSSKISTVVVACPPLHIVRFLAAIHVFAQTVVEALVEPYRLIEMVWFLYGLASNKTGHFCDFKEYIDGVTALVPVFKAFQSQL